MILLDEWLGAKMDVVEIFGDSDNEEALGKKFSRTPSKSCPKVTDIDLCVKDLLEVRYTFEMQVLKPAQKESMSSSLSHPRPR